MKKILVLVALATAALGAQQNRVDTITPSAPELGGYGAHDIGVCTIQGQSLPDEPHRREPREQGVRHRVGSGDQEIRSCFSKTFS